jgi:hypothetical protein
MTSEVLYRVLSLTIRIVRGGPQDSHTALFYGFTVAINVLYANQHVSSWAITFVARFHHDYSAITDVELSPMAPHPNSKREAECVAEPLDSLEHVWINKHGNHGAFRDRAI